MESPTMEGSMEIERLNALMFDAEAHLDCEGLPWDEFLGHVLADDLALRRSAASKPLEDRETFLEATRDAEPLNRTIVPGSTRVWESDTVAAVSSVVELEGRVEQFTNTRVFTAGGRYGWLCNWWQVTAAEADSPQP
jgi:hypothetical protein